MKSLFLLIILSLPLYAQTFKINGYVFDRESKQELSYATIRVKETSTGTTTNMDGKFHLELSEGEYEIVVSYIGYNSQSRKIKLPSMKYVEVGLQPNSILLPEIVIGSDQEDPSYRIIREAIKRKSENKKGLNTLEFDGYSKKILRSEGQITLIEESFVKGLDSLGKKSREFILSTYKTENLKSSVNKNFNISNIRLNNVDFTDEKLELLGNKVNLPLCQDAFDYYDYKLKDTRVSEEKSVYTIQVIPRSKIRPLLQGTIYIEDSTFALIGLELKTNEGMTIPYLTGLRLDYSQKMSKNDSYWLPQYTRLDFMAGLNFGGLLKIGAMEYEQVYNISRYKLNPLVPDTVFTMKKQSGNRATQVKVEVGTGTSESIEVSEAKDSVKKDSVKKNPEYKPIELTKAEIDSLRPVPLSESELKAYNFLDSTKKITSFIKPTGALSRFVNTDGKKSESGFWDKASEAFFDYIDFNNTRVSGIALGLKYKNDYRKTLEYKASARYDIGLKRTEMEGGLNLYLSKEKSEGLLINGFNKVKRWNENTQFGDLINAASLTIGLEDNFNYFWTKGFSIGLEKNWPEHFSTQLRFISEKQTSLTELFYHRIFNSIRNKRLNPSIAEGQDIRIGLNIVLGQNAFDFQPVQQDGISINTETSLKDLNSNFNYFKIRSVAQVRFKTIFRELLLSPYLLLRLEGGLINGSFGLQHLLNPENSVEAATAFGIFKGIRPYEFTGSRMLALHAEHNWCGVLFQSVGLNSLREMNLGIITGASLLKTWDTPEYYNVSGQKQPYWEAYLGINGIFALLRLDIAYTSNNEPVVRLGMAHVF